MSPVPTPRAAAAYNSGDPADEGGDDEPLLAAELAAVEDQGAAERLRRLQADNDVLVALQLTAFDRSTPEWKVFQGALVEYGYAVFMAWLTTGSVYRMAANHGGGRGIYGLHRIPEGLKLGQDDAHGLAVDLMVKSLTTFRDRTLLNADPSKRWSPRGGASLRTFFIGRCLMDFPDVYVQYARANRRAATELNEMQDLDPATLQHAVVDPESLVADRQQLDEVFGEDDVTRAMFELQRQGYSNAEIAELLTAAGFPSTEGSVRTKMTRLRFFARTTHYRR